MAHMFQMTTNIVTALKSVVTRFSRDGIARVKGESVFLAAKQLTAVVTSLTRVDALSNEVVGEVMDGLSKGSVAKLTEVFWKVLCTIQLRLPLPTRVAVKQHLTKSFTLFQKPLAFTTLYLLVIIGIFQVDGSITVGTVMVI